MRNLPRNARTRTIGGASPHNVRGRWRSIGASLLLLSAAGIANAGAAEAHQLKTVAEGLDHPWCLAFLPDGRLLVTELGGNLRQISADGLVSDPIANVPPVYRRSQGGLFDVLPHPDFGRNQTLFLSYAAGPPKNSATSVARARLTDEGLADVQVIFSVTPRIPTPVHYGGRMIFLPEGALLLTTGDGYDFREASQDLTGLLGKTVRIHLDGRIPDDNPFVGREDAHPAIYTYGHRNPQGLALDADGRIWLHEHGPRGGDEANLLTPGANYGWPAVTHGIDYNGARISPLTQAPGMADAAKVWTPSIAPSGLAVYTGDRFPEWQGDLFVGALVGKEVRRLDLEDGQVVGEEALFASLGRRVRDVRVNDGYLYVVEDGSNARVLRVEPADS